MSITLTNPFTVNAGGSQVENDTAGACTALHIDFVAKTYTVTFQSGTLSGSPSNLVPGPYAQQIVVTVYVGATNATQTFGTWWLNGIKQASIVPSADLTEFIAQVIGDRNTAEGFASVAGGLMPGTQVPWVAGSTL